MNRRDRTRALQAVRAQMAEVEHLALLVYAAREQGQRLDERRAAITAHEEALLAGLGHFAGLDTAARLSGVDPAELRRLMKQHPAEATAAAVQAFEAHGRRQRRTTSTQAEGSTEAHLAPPWETEQ